MKHLLLVLLLLGAGSAVRAEELGVDGRPLQVEDFSKSKVIVSAAKHLGESAESMAEVIDRVFNRYGAPDAIIRGEEASGGFIATLRYGRGSLHMQSGETRPIFWRGPGLGIGFPSGAAVKSFILVYDIKKPEDVYKYFFGIEGSAIFGGGIALNYLQRNNVVVVPVRVGVGFKLDASVNYLAFTPKRNWSPF